MSNQPLRGRFWSPGVSRTWHTGILFRMRSSQQQRKLGGSAVVWHVAHSGETWWYSIECGNTICFVQWQITQQKIRFHSFSPTNMRINCIYIYIYIYIYMLCPHQEWGSEPNEQGCQLWYGLLVFQLYPTASALCTVWVSVLISCWWTTCWLAKSPFWPPVLQIILVLFSAFIFPKITQVWPNYTDRWWYVAPVQPLQYQITLVSFLSQFQRLLNLNHC